MITSRVLHILAIVAWLCATGFAAADRHVAECDEESCAREGIPQDERAPIDSPSLVVVHAHGCSCHVGVAITVDLVMHVVSSWQTVAGFGNVPRDGIAHDPPPTRPPIVRA